MEITASSIDEVGFVHPSQFAAINDISDTSQAYTTDLSFWIKNHKLGISTESIHPLYTAAKHAFMSSLQQYKRVKLDTSSSLTTIETELMKHSRALLKGSCYED
ncbi:hypothetical protein L1887_35567 [Cichorium endivia]|nr:hypothetical protein L1887_35567 [Cichorium endivia]